MNISYFTYCKDKNYFLIPNIFIFTLSRKNKYPTKKQQEYLPFCIFVKCLDCI